MPLILHEQMNPAGEIGLWQIEESEEWFRQQLDLSEEEAAQLACLKGAGRRQEWLAARQLVHRMSGRAKRGIFIKDQFGKPHLEGTSWQISISHTHHHLSAAIAAPQACGIDIQGLVPKITRLRRRFVTSQEAAVLRPKTELEQLHLIWGGKEALYKAHGRREIDWLRHLEVIPTNYRAQGGQLIGRLLKDAHPRTFLIRYRLWRGTHMLVYAIESTVAS